MLTVNAAITLISSNRIAGWQLGFRLELVSCRWHWPRQCGLWKRGLLSTVKPQIKLVVQSCRQFVEICWWTRDPNLFLEVTYQVCSLRHMGWYKCTATRISTFYLASSQAKKCRGTTLWSLLWRVDFQNVSLPPPSCRLTWWDYVCKWRSTQLNS